MSDDPQGWHPPTEPSDQPQGPPPPGWGPPPGWTPQPGWGPPAQQQWGWGAPPPPENKPGIIPLRPLAVGEVLDGAFAMIRRHPGATLGLAALIAALQALLSVVIPGLLGAAVTPLADAGNSVDSSGDTGLQVFQLISQLAGFLVSGVLGTLFSGMIIVVVGEAVLGHPVSPGAVWGRVRPRFWALIGVALLVGLLPVLAVAVIIAAAVTFMVVVGAVGALIGVPLIVAGVVGFVWLRTAWSLASPALVLENLGPVRSLGRSRGLVRGAWWRLFGLRLLAGVIAGTVTGVIALPFALIGAFISGSGAFQDPGRTPIAFIVFYALGTALAAAITLPFGSGVQGLLYVDRRIRAEALDVRLAEAAAATA